MPDFKLHIFDLDDTLINTRYSYKMAQKKALEKVFRNLGEKETLSDLKTLGWLCSAFGSGNVRQYFKAFLTSKAIPRKKSADLLEKLLETYHLVFWSELKPFKGVAEFLSDLEDRGKIISLVSNGEAVSQEKKLKKTRLKVFLKDELRFYSGRFSSEHRKPSPYMVKLACDKTRVAPEKTVFYGNTEEDILAGNLAGATSVFYGNLPSLSPDLPFVAVPNMTFKNWREAAEQFRR